MGEAVRIAASNGQLWNSDLSARSGVFLSGGDASARPTVDVRNNRILYRTNGIASGWSGELGDRAARRVHRIMRSSHHLPIRDPRARPRFASAPLTSARRGRRRWRSWPRAISSAVLPSTAS